MKRSPMEPIYIGAALTAVGAALFAANARAGSGADALLNAVAPTGAVSAGAPVPGGATANTFDALALTKDIQLTDAFLMQFFSSWQAEKNLPYEVNMWAMRVMKHETAHAAHLVTAIAPMVPESFRPAFEAARIYTYFRLDVPQTFFDQWVAKLRDESFRESRLGVALEQTIAPEFDRWLTEHAIVATPEQQAFLATLSPQRGLLFATIRGWASLRQGDRGADLLEILPATNAIKIPLAETVTLGLARKGDLAAAGKVLKRHLEPALESRRDPALLAGHYLQVARLLYQVGVLDGAEEFYQKIPNGSAEFLKAREELTWVWLRKGDTARLRGELVTLGGRFFEERFEPEVYLVRAISNLKLCFYDAVEKDFAQFVKNNDRWAKAISSALKSDAPPTPNERDFHTRWAERALERRQAEAARLATLGQESIAAALPAVGEQQHWVKAREQALATVESLKKRTAEEYRRQWKNQEAVLTEAIRKMKFVKVELLTELHAVAKAGDSDAIRISAAAPLRSDPAVKAGIAQEEKQDNKLSFPFDGVSWPDELFRLRSAAQGRCLQARGTP